MVLLICLPSTPRTNDKYNFCAVSSSGDDPPVSMGSSMEGERLYEVPSVQLPRQGRICVSAAHLPEHILNLG